MRRPIGAVVGMLGQFLVLPATGFALSLAFGLQPYEALGVLMISCSPGGSFSNFFTFWVDGDLALRCIYIPLWTIKPVNGWRYCIFTENQVCFRVPVKRAYGEIYRKYSNCIIFIHTLSYITRYCSIMMTTCSSLLAFGGMPFNLWLYSRHWMSDDSTTLVIPFGSIITSLAFITVPVVIGMIIRHFHEKAASIITKVGSLFLVLGKYV